MFSAAPCRTGRGPSPDTANGVPACTAPHVYRYESYETANIF